MVFEVGSRVEIRGFGGAEPRTPGVMVFEVGSRVEI